MRSVLVSAFVLALIVGAVGCGGGSDQSASETTTSTEASATNLTRCPNTEKDGKGSSPSAYGWGGSVSGIGCLAAGKLISDDLMGGFNRAVLDDLNVNDLSAVNSTEPGDYKRAGFACHYGVHDADAGWPVRCGQGDQVIAFNVTP